MTEFTTLRSILNEVGKDAASVLSYLFISWLPALFPALPLCAAVLGTTFTSLPCLREELLKLEDSKRGESGMFSLPFSDISFRGCISTVFSDPLEKPFHDASS